MSLTNELQDIIITIDTREKNEKRIKAVEDWAVAHGACVEHNKLDLCDYALLGEFRGVPVNLGIEAKGLHDFAGSYQDLPDKLAKSYQLYDDVALFVETNNYMFQVDPDGFHATINNPAVRNGDANVLPLAVMENMLASFQREGVHVRQLRSEAHFPYAIAGLLINIVKPLHTGLTIKDTNFTSQYLNVLGKVPHISFKRAQKLIKCYPNMFWLCSASEESYKEILGNKIGSRLYDFIRNPELVTDAWKSGKFRDGTDKSWICPVCNTTTKDEDGNYVHTASCNFKNAIVDYLTEEYPHALSVDELCDHFNIEQGDNKKQFIIHLKELARNKQITSPTPGLFQVISKHCNDKSVEVLPPNPFSSTPLLIKKPCTNESVKELDKSQSSSTAQERDAQPPVTHSAKSKLGTPDNISNDKTDKSRHNLPRISQESVPLSQTPVLSESEEEQLFGKNHPDWKPVNAEDMDLDFEARTKDHKMSIRKQLEVFLEQPHTQQECVDKLSNFSKGAVWEHVMRMKREGVVVEFDDGTLVMTR